jgi:RNA polymerase sigma factor (sigma-70 family)
MDRDLLMAFRAGTHDGLERIYVQYAGEVRRLLARHTKVADDDLADVVQEVFLRVFSPTVRTSYDEKRAFAPFLHAVARNVFVDWARRRKRERGQLLNVAQADLVPDPPVIESSQFGGLLETAERYVQALPPDLRAVYVERFLRSRTQEAAATSLGISRQTLRTRECRLIDGLRTLLRQSGVRVADSASGHHCMGS